MKRATLERAGIILQMLAGVLFGLDFYVTADRIIYINNVLTAFFSPIPTIYLVNLIAILMTIFLILQIYSYRKKVYSFGDIGKSYSDKKSIIHLLSFFDIIVLIMIIIMLWTQYAPSIIQISPKGSIGSIAIILFIVGNAVRLWTTFK